MGGGSEHQQQQHQRQQRHRPRAAAKRVVFVAILLLIGFSCLSRFVTLFFLADDASSRPIHHHHRGDELHAPPLVRYHMYDPSELDMYRNCEKASIKSMDHAKFSVDRLFVEQLISEKKSVSPEEADIFVIPALYSDSVRG